jgi:hypothetical protein
LQDAVFLAKRDLRRGVVVSTDGSNNEPSNEHVTDLRLNRREMEDGAVPVREQCVTEAVRRERKQPMNESEESLRRRNLADVTSWQVETKSVKDKRRGRQLLNAEEKQALEIFRLRKQPMNESEESLRRRNLADVTSWQVETKSVKDKRRGRQLLNAEEKQALEIFRHFLDIRKPRCQEGLSLMIIQMQLS